MYLTEGMLKLLKPCIHFQRSQLLVEMTETSDVKHDEICCRRCESLATRRGKGE